MGGVSSSRLRLSSAGAVGAAALLVKARSIALNVSCIERKKMATAPEEEGATKEQLQLTPQDEDYNPFTDEGTSC